MIKIDSSFETPKDTVVAMKRAIAGVGAGFEYVYSCRLSNLAGDYYLFYVIAKGGHRDGYVLWLFNDSSESLHQGNYDLDFKSALRLLSDKLNFYEEEAK